MNNTCHECEKQKFILPYEYFANPLTVVEEGGDWIQSAIKHPGRCTPGSPNYDCPKGSPQWNLAQRFKHGDLHKEANGGEMIKRADGSYSRRGLWDNIRANAGSGKAPTKEMLEQERKINSKQLGGDAQSQIVEVIKMYAKLHNVEPQVIVQKLQELDENSQQQALQSMVAEVQQGTAQQAFPMSYADNTESPDMQSYQVGGSYNYPQTGGYGTQGRVGLGGGYPYILPAMNTVASGDSDLAGGIKAATGVLGLASGLAGSLLGWGKAAEWVGNKIKPGSNILQNTNNTLKNVVDFGIDAGYITPYYNKNIKKNKNVSPINYNAVESADFTKMPVYNDNPKYKDTMVAMYGGSLPKHQGNIPGVPSTVQSAGMMMDDGSTDYNEGYFQAYKQDNNAYNVDYDKQYMNMSLEDEQLKKQKNQGSQQNLDFQKNSNFNGMEYAQKALAGLGAFNSYLSWRENKRRKQEYDAMLQRVGNTDFRLSSNNPNPYGNYTLNVGPANNFQLGMTTPMQDFGTTAKYGGSYKEGGEYQVSEEELLQLMQDGAEIEFINK